MLNLMQKCIDICCNVQFQYIHIITLLYELACARRRVRMCDARGRLASYLASVSERVPTPVRPVSERCDCEVCLGLCKWKPAVPPTGGCRVRRVFDTGLVRPARPGSALPRLGGGRFVYADQLVLRILCFLSMVPSM